MQTLLLLNVNGVPELLHPNHQIPRPLARAHAIVDRRHLHKQSRRYGSIMKHLNHGEHVLTLH
jgi:hypothetical protein